MDNAEPTLINGADLKFWLKAKWDDRKRKSGPGEIYCTKCAEPRAPVAGTMRLEAHPNGNALAISNCIVCGSRQNRAVAIRRLAEFAAEHPDQNLNVLGFNGSGICIGKGATEKQPPGER